MIVRIFENSRLVFKMKKCVWNLKKKKKNWISIRKTSHELLTTIL